MFRSTQKFKEFKAVKSKPKALRHFKVDPVLKMMQDESMYTVTNKH